MDGNLNKLIEGIKKENGDSDVCIIIKSMLGAYAFTGVDFGQDDYNKTR